MHCNHLMPVTSSINRHHMWFLPRYSIEHNHMVVRPGRDCRRCHWSVLLRHTIFFSFNLNIKLNRAMLRMLHWTWFVFDATANGLLGYHRYHWHCCYCRSCLHRRYGQCIIWSAELLSLSLVDVFNSFLRLGLVCCWSVDCLSRLSTWISLSLCLNSAPYCLWTARQFFFVDQSRQATAVKGKESVSYTVYVAINCHSVASFQTTTAAPRTATTHTVFHISLRKIFHSFFSFILLI